MDGEAGLARNSNKKLSHDRRRAKQRAKREEALPMRRGRTLDVTPHIAVLNIITKGRYLRLGRGFPIRT